MDTLEEEIREAYKDKELSDKEIADYLDSYFNEKQKGTKAEKLNMYVEIQRSLVDDDGEVHEFEDPYYVNDEAYCCGHELKEVDGELYCEVCGTSYDNE
jgi:hemerythrin-like domain-containing protein